MKTSISPKVTAGANWSVYAGFLLTILNLITPDMLAPLGKWAPLVYCGISGLAFAIGAYRKEDPLRTAGSALAASGITVDDLKSLIDAATKLLATSSAPATTAPATIIV